MKVNTDMNASEVLRIVDAIHRDKNINKEIVFQAIEAALVSAAKKQYGEEQEIVLQIDRKDGAISGTHNGVPMDPEETMGRIVAQTAKQVIIQKIREAERDALYDEYRARSDSSSPASCSATRERRDRKPRQQRSPTSPQRTDPRRNAPSQRTRSRDRLRSAQSRQPRENHPQPHPAALVQRLFEQEIPEIAEGVIEIRAIAREPGYRSKVAVSSPISASIASVRASASAAIALRTSSMSLAANGSTSSAGATNCTC